MAAKNGIFLPLSVLLIVTLFGCLLVSCNSKAGVSNAERFDTMSNGINPVLSSSDKSVAAAASASANPGAAGAGIGNFGASDPNGNESYNPVVAGAPSGNSAGNCFPRDRLTADDLLPKGAADSRWAQANPAGQGDVSDINFLTAGYHIGVNTTGSTRKNGNLQLRSEPPNPQNPVSPWNQATIEPDYLRKPLEIGE